MARIRTVKPELFRHEEMYQLEKDTGLPIRLAWMGLFTVADREGRFRWKAKELKLDVLPYDEVDFAQILNALHFAGFINCYQNGNSTYGYIPTWKLHQVINTREAASRIPAPDEGTLIDAHTTGHCNYSETHVRAQGELEGKGREKEEEGKRKVARVHASRPGAKEKPIAIAPARNETNPGPTQELVAHWKWCFARRYGEEGITPGKEWASAKGILKTVSIERAKSLVEAYFQMNEAWFLTKRHSLSTLLDNLNGVNVFAKTGATLNRVEISQQEKKDAVLSQLERIDRGLL